MLTTGVLTVVLVLTSADGCQGGEPFVRVSLEWQARSVPAALGDIAREEVDAIWRRLGVDVHWTPRHAARASGPAVHVIVTDELLQTSSALPRLGWIEFWGDTPGNLLQVSAAAALAAVFQGQTIGRLSNGQPVGLLQFIAARIIGRAIAHELGHYLLRSRQHTASGLMRRVFPAHEGTIPFLDRYGLDRNQQVTLRVRGAGRTMPCGSVRQ